MFTGIVESVGRVVGIDVAADGGDARVSIQDATVTSDAQLGDSIAVAGVCLTVVDVTGDVFRADVMAETLARTTVGSWATGSSVNLERSVTASGRLGGHVVQGHVDGTATLLGRQAYPAYDVLRFAAGPELARYIAGKGAIAVDGTSLTVVDVADVDEGAEFTIGVIPQTRQATTLGGLAVGDRVNIEVDVMAKYVERLLSSGAVPAAVGR